jgi:hypothetical protein
MIVQPMHVVSENCYRVYIIHEGLRQQVGRDFCYSDLSGQEKVWLNCLKFAREIEDQLEYYKDND